MLPPVILMQRLDSSLDPTLVACELPSSYEFQGICLRSHGFTALFSPLGSLKGSPYMGGHRATGQTASSDTGLAPQRACLLGWLGAWLAPGLAGLGGWLWV